MNEEIVQEDFAEEGKGQWVLNHNNYRVVVRQTNGSLEIVIRAKITANPSSEDWATALATVNTFYQRLVLAENREGNAGGGLGHE